jgi:hypothetical protein
MFKEIKSYDYTHTTDFDFKALCELLAKEYHDLAIEKIKMNQVQLMDFYQSFYNLAPLQPHKQKPALDDHEYALLRLGPN